MDNPLTTYERAISVRAKEIEHAQISNDIGRETM